jgi:hypothetical protein
MPMAPDLDGIQRLDEVVEDLVADLRFHREVERLHRLGPRATGELLLEIAECLAARSFVDERVKAYVALDPKVVKALGADRFPTPPIYPVAK